MSDSKGEFAGRVALVTGAASGIGRATAGRLAAADATVICADLDYAGVEATVASLLRGDAGHIAELLDVRDEAAWDRLLQSVKKRFGRLDVLVHAAGVSAASPLTETSLDAWRAVFAVNTDGAFLATRTGIRAMQTTGGSIVLVASASGVKPAPGAAAYSASKSAVCMLAAVAAKECLHADRPIRVNAVSPGGVKTPMWDTMPFFRELVEKTGSRDAAFAALEQGPGGSRFAEPEEIADAIVYLASDRARSITGQNLVIDGGYVL